VVKITDVAQHAGVSPSTVSYVLSGKRTISESTQRRVEESIRTLGYHPHAGARALASNRTNVLALVVPLRQGVHVPVIMQVAVAVVTTARRFGFDVLLLTQDEGAEALRRVAQSALCDGFVVMDIELHDSRLPTLRATPRPSVLIGVPENTEGLTCVDLDFRAVGELCVEHLAELGHRSIALVGSPPEVYERGTGYAERVAEGFTRAARRYGIDATVHACEATSEAALAMTWKLLDEQPDLTGVVVHNEPIVDSIVEALNRAGRRVPDDMSVVAVRPDELAMQSVTPVTWVPFPAEELGVRAVELLMAKLEKRPVPEVTLLPPRITEWASTAVRRAPQVSAAAAGRTTKGRPLTAERLAVDTRRKQP
jgi:DNA-binding LacI/PurR family transcriptional regulator